MRKAFLCLALILLALPAAPASAHHASQDTSSGDNPAYVAGMPDCDTDYFSWDIKHYGDTANTIDRSSSAVPVCYDMGLGADTMTGSSFTDNLFGRDGNDELSGGPSLDNLHGGLGADDLFGDGGNDIMYGSYGNDELNGGNGNDSLFGGGWCNASDHYNFDSYISGYDVTTIPCAWGGQDILIGGDGNDWIWESNTDGPVSDGVYDEIYGGAGTNDYCAVGPEDFVTGCETVVELDSP